jgi:folate-dependent phosphoribosylglycinamide formyltransferase PurN
MKNIVILISGDGSNMEAIIRAAKAQNWQKHLQARVAAVISNRPSAKGLGIAQHHGVTTQAVDHTSFANATNPREAFDTALIKEIDQHAPALVVFSWLYANLDTDVRGPLPRAFGQYPPFPATRISRPTHPPSRHRSRL